MVYTIDRSLLEKGMAEVLRVKINMLEYHLGIGSQTGLEVAVREYQQARDIARSLLVDTLPYDEFLLRNTKELKQRFGIEIK